MTVHRGGEVRLIMMKSMNDVVHVASVSGGAMTVHHGGEVSTRSMDESYEYTTNDDGTNCLGQ